MISLGGNVCIRNGIELDYCFKQAIESLLPVCDEVIVCDGESTDGTQEYIRGWMTREPKIKLCVYPWKHPKGDIDFWVDWLNFAREHVRCDYTIQLDADEVLHEDSYPAIKSFTDWLVPPVQPFSIWCDRLNFWADHRHLIPQGHCCSSRVVRLGPQNVWMPSDGPHPRGAQMIGMARDWFEPIRIFHYGFLRHTEAFFKKARAIEGYFFAGTFDPRMAKVEGDPQWMKEIKDVEWTSKLIPYNGTHPAVAHRWLEQRGYHA